MQEINATKMFFCLTLDKPRKKCISILLYFFSWFKEFLLLLHSEYKVFIILHSFSFLTKIHLIR